MLWCSEFNIILNFEISYKSMRFGLISDTSTTFIL